MATLEDDVMLDLRRSMMRPAARLIPLPLQTAARKVQTSVRARGLTPADVVGASYPKSGSTWLRFMVADLACEDSSSVGFANIAKLSPPLGAQRSAPRLVNGRGRFVKTHESFAAFSSFTCRGLYVVRDGRDVAVSLFHFLRRLGVYSGPFDEYLSAFLDGRVVNYGSWQDHVSTWYGAAARRPDAITVLHYEDLLEPGGPQTLRDTLARIGWDVSLEAVQAAFDRNDFERMRRKESQADTSDFRGMTEKSTASVPFVRSGKAGQWRQEFTEEQVRQFREAAGEVLALAGYESDQAGSDR
jgi:hypothetical protein